MRIALLTVSDRSARGERPDTSGPALAEAAAALDWEVVRRTILPDDSQALQTQLCSWADSGAVDVILTTGGTGFAPRDVTPEATLAVIDRRAPGLAEVMRAAGLRATPHAMLSRAEAGIRKSTIIINLPGSPKAAIESLAAIQAVLPHAIQLLRDDPEAEAGHQSERFER